MKTFSSLFVIILLLAACSNNTKNAKIEEKTINNSEILNQQIIPQIESYYLAKFGKNGINSKQNNDTNFEILKTFFAKTGKEGFVFG